VLTKDHAGTVLPVTHACVHKRNETYTNTFKTHQLYMANSAYTAISRRLIARHSLWFT